MPIGGMAFFGQNQHPRLTTTYINQRLRVGDPGAGVPVSTEMMSGSIVQEYLGTAGGKLTITNPWGTQFADPEVGPVYGGLYQYVRVDKAAAAPLVRGSVVFWLDELNYLVTAAGQTTGGTPVPNKIAGIAMNNTKPGYWDFIQISGIAMVFFNAAGTGLAQVVSINPAGTPPLYPTLGTATGPTSIGTTQLTTPIANALSPVELNIIQGYNF